jgi:hypothetical protein
MSFWIINRKKGTVTSLTISFWGILIFLTPLLAIVVALMGTIARRTTSELVAAMYRTEANLTAIESAIRAYKIQYIALPPSGTEGLQKAIDELDRTVNFYPEGVPKDGWDRTYIYVNSDDYGRENSLAIKDAASGQYHNPDGYQLYSLGADGKRSPEDGATAPDRFNDDNINNWDKRESWRAVYRKRSQEMRNHGKE